MDRAHALVGFLLQANAGSLLVKFGRRFQAAAEMTTEQGQTDFIGSDAQDLEK